MNYMTESEVKRVFEVAEKFNHEHALILRLGYFHGLRVSEIVPGRPSKRKGATIQPNELCGLRGCQIQDGQLSVERLKNSEQTIQPLHPSLAELQDRAKANPTGFLFNISRQRVDEFTRRYTRLAGVHRDKGHFHSIGKHSIAMSIWERTHSLGQIQSYLGHKSSSSSIQYLREADHSKAIGVVQAIQL